MATTGSTPDSVRRRNLSRILSLVHESRGLPRSALTAGTGLNRSTVADLVAELVALELVAEVEAVRDGRVGRPSPSVVPHLSPVALAINPELDAVTVGVVGLGARVDTRVRHPVDHAVTPAETAAIVTEVVAGLRRGVLRGRRVLGAGIAVPGLVRDSDGLVRWAPHLDWTDEPVTDLLSRALRLPVVAANDASLGAQAERMFGVGRGVDDLVYLNGGASGIGGGVISGGRLLGGAGGYAGEFGQNRPGVGDPDDRLSPDGTLEDEVRRARLLAAVRLDSADESELAESVLGSDDPAVRGELARQRRVLAVALGNAVNVLNPRLIVLGGFLATLLDSDPEELDRLVAASSVSAAWEQADIRPAALGADLLMIGAAELVFAALLADPAAPPLPKGR